MGDDVARFVFTDGPCNVAIGGEVEARKFARASGEMTEAQFLGFHRKWIEAVLPSLADGGLLGTFIDWRSLSIVHAAATALALTPLDLVVWAKANAGAGSLYRSGYELLPLFKKGTAAPVNNLSGGKRGRLRSNLWTYPQASLPGSAARKGRSDPGGEKPTAMLEGAMIDLTNRGEIVLDPFLGSGLTLIAAENAGRVCRGVELDPRFIDVIIRRHEALTRSTAVLADTGEAFAKLAARRLDDQDSRLP